MMLLTTQLVDDGLAIIAVSQDLVHASAVKPLADTCESLSESGRRGILIDMSRVRRMNMSGLASVVELVSRHPKWDIGLCAVPKHISQMVSQSGLDRGLSIFADVDSARRAPAFLGRSLSGTRTVLLCAGRGSRVAPMTDITPKPMLDIAGQPVLHRIMDHLAGFGLRDILFNPGHLGDQVIDYFQATIWPDTRIQFANEGQFEDGVWTAAPIGSASALKRMQVTSAAFRSDFVVMCGDALVDLDLAEMMRRHRETGAAVTIAAQTVAADQTRKYGMIETAPAGQITRFVEKPKPGTTDSRLANTGIYIMKPEILGLIPNAPDLDIATHLLPAVLAARLPMRVYDQPFAWVDIGCGRDYAEATSRCLAGDLPFAPPTGKEVRPGVWAAASARVSNQARIEGPCHIGQGAVVAPGATLRGACAIGAGAEVAGNSVLQDCIVMPDTRVGSGTWGKGLILHGDWAVNQAWADGRKTLHPPLDHVETLRSVTDTDLPLPISA